MPKESYRKKPENNRKNLRVERMLARGIRRDGTDPKRGPPQAERVKNN